MTFQANDARIIELELIKNDTNFYFDLLNCVISSKKSSVLTMSLLSYFSFFIVETYGYFSKTNPQYAQAMKLQHEEVLRVARTKIKLFEEYDILDILEWVTNQQKAEFIDSHTGPLAWLKKAIQPDLGLFVYGGHLISTTHTIHSSFVHKKDQSGNFIPSNLQGPMLRSIGVDIGKYVSSLYYDLILSQNIQPANLCDYRINDQLIQNMDVKSDKYLPSIFNGPSSMQVNACLVLFLAFFNSVHFIIQQMTVKKTEAFLKLKYVTLYQLATSLEKLQNYYYSKGLLSEKSKRMIKEILGDKELKIIKAQKKFRNVLVHYALDDIPESILAPNTRFFGLTEHFFTGSTMEDLDNLLDRQMGRVSEALEEWMHYELK